MNRQNKMNGSGGRAENDMGQEETGRDKKGLLECVAEKMQCQYLSDLRKTARKYQCYTVLLTVSAKDYSASEWNEAARYLTGENVAFSDPEVSRTWLLSALHKN